MAKRDRLRAHLTAAGCAVVLLVSAAVVCAAVYGLFRLLDAML